MPKIMTTIFKRISLNRFSLGWLMNGFNKLIANILSNQSLNTLNSMLNVIFIFVFSKSFKIAELLISEFLHTYS